MRVFGSEHELKLLNLTVIFYLIAGALVFHWLGEFEDPPPQPVSAGHGLQQPASQSTAATQKPGDAEQKFNDKMPHRADRLSDLRLASVRRMWNITNQLNILYEANWTELVLAELVEFERQFVESLEILTSRDELSLELEVELEAGEREEQERDKTKKSAADQQQQQQQEAAATKKRQLENQQRIKSIKRALVHSLATITTMGSPVQAPHSQLGRLLTILYGSLGIPLLVVTVAKSGHSLAASSLNCLLILRHYCISLPLHFLCCSCNLFVCLRWLSWCCCCCCCSYLCCLSDNKQQKCCDYTNAPKLSLLKSRAFGRRGRGRTRRRLNKIEQQQQQQYQPGSHATEGGSFVIGFNLGNNQMQGTGTGTGTGEQQKSVRFVDDNNGGFHEEHEGQESDNASDRDDLELSQEQSSSLLFTSCTILALYLALGAYYHSEQTGPTVSFVDALFACYAMLATSTLPESFHLDKQPANPLNYYKSHFSPGHLANPANVTQPTHLPPKRFAFSQEVRLTIDSLYLLIGLNLISACAHFARLWLNGIAQERLAKGCQSHMLASGGQASKMHGHCNGGSPVAPEINPNEITSTTSLMCGSFDHQNPHSGVVTSCPPPIVAYNNHHHHLQQQQPPQQPPVIMNRNTSNEQINLAELFVMGAGGGGAQMIEAPDQGASFASSSASSQARSNASLCAHHALQTMPSPHTSETSSHLHLAPDARHLGNRATLCSGGSLARPRPTHNHHRRQASHLELDQIDLISKMKQSSSSFQLADDSQQQAFGTMRANQQVQYPIMSNGLGTTSGGQHSVEPDSSPNTFDTNSQTMSSLSSRTTMMNPSAGPTQRLAGGNERTISWYGQVDSAQ